MPFRRGDAEAILEAGCHGLRQCDLGQEDEDLRLGVLQRFGDGLEVDFRLAGTGDAIEQRRTECVLAHHAAEIGRRFNLLAGELLGREGGIGLRKGRIERALDMHQRAGFQQPLHDA